MKNSYVSLPSLFSCLLTARMAECPSSDSATEQALKKLADQLNCGICLESYTDPKLLQCLHVFCKKCLEQLTAQGRQGQSLDCPNCRQLTQIPPNGISGLQGAFHIHHLFEIQDALKKIKAPQQTICEKCKKRNATSYCRDCGQFICEYCNEVLYTRLGMTFPLTRSSALTSWRVT